MSTDYYVVCDQCRKSYWAWQRTAGGVGSPPIADDRKAFQEFLDEHLHQRHPLRFVSEHDDQLAMENYDERHPQVLAKIAKEGR